MEGHPGGQELTEKLLVFGNLKAPMRIADFGAGDGKTVIRLRAQGYDAVGVDKEPLNSQVRQGDIRNTEFQNEEFDVVLSECTLSVCGDTRKALLEAFRIIKPGGVLLISDVYFLQPDAPVLSLGEAATLSNWKKAVQDTGFSEIVMKDYSEYWRRYILDCIWEGTAEKLCARYGKGLGRETGYFILKAIKPKE